jgi:cellulose synthase/poly-beta-1,6-N-acetylglucosamine synthase-like glycosyltransferase
MVQSNHHPHHKMDGVLGKLQDDQKVAQEFTFSQVRGNECLGQVCQEVCDALKHSFKQENRKFLCVCVPCYNESTVDLMKTVASLMKNVDFMKHKARFNDDDMGRELREDFESLEIVIVPIFDGYQAMNPTVKEWLASDFPGSLDGMDTKSAPELVHVRVCSARWWYYCCDSRNEKESNASPSSGENLQGSLLQAVLEPPGDSSEATKSFIQFQLMPIIKKTNHRKHNSHHWFFKGICVGLNPSLVFLTDCGTTYRETCIARLLYALRTRKDLIGVTARQRVETPNPNFHPCEKTSLPFLHGNHEGIGSPPCWKCYLSYLLSAAPLQGFEFEATLILNSALFNLVEAMPVLPGPCQLLDWPRMNQHDVVDEYYDLLFNQDHDITGSEAVPLPQGYLNSASPVKISRPSTSIGAEMSPVSTACLVHADLENNQMEKLASSPNLTFTEFLRVNMRLAEDRVLSFVTVFSTGFGTKWVPGATFYYEPEVNFQSLLTQR